MSELRTVRLGGELGEKYVKEINLRVQHVGEAIRALEANFRGFRDHLVRAEERGVGFVVKVADREVTEEEMVLVSEGDILIMPALFGASAGGRILVGAAIVAAAYYLGPVSAGGTGLLGVTAQGAGYGLGASMIIGGAIEMLTPIPRMGNLELSSADNSKPSYVFNGPVQTSAQGLPVPIGCGTMLISGTIISGGIVAEDICTDGNNSDPVLIDNDWG